MLIYTCIYYILFYLHWVLAIADWPFSLVCTYYTHRAHTTSVSSLPLQTQYTNTVSEHGPWIWLTISFFQSFFFSTCFFSRPFFTVTTEGIHCILYSGYCIDAPVIARALVCFVEWFYDRSPRPSVCNYAPKCNTGHTHR